LEEELFTAYVDRAFRLVEQQPTKIVLLGVPPSDAEQEYGYILPGEKPGDQAASGIRTISRFVEKPKPDLARDLVSGGGLWNTLVMVFKITTFLNEISKIAPVLYSFFDRIGKAIGSQSFSNDLRKLYQEMLPVNLSSGLLEVLSLERPSPLWVLPVRGVHWSDWGSEQRILHSLQQSGRLNCLNRDGEGWGTGIPYGSIQKNHCRS
jgi:mannose-1-phosphate guanylyltransferase